MYSYGGGARGWIVDWFKDEERFARVVSLDEIRKNDHNLNISRYVSTDEDEDEIDVAAEVVKLNALRQQRDEAEAKMMGFLKELGYDA